MWLRLAAKLHMSVRRCQQEVDAREFAEWLAFDDIDPWTEHRGDLRAAIIAMAANRAMGGEADVKDFLPQFGEVEEAGDLDARLDRALSFFA